MIRSLDVQKLPTKFPDPSKILYGRKEPDPFPKDNIFPLEWKVLTPRLLEIYDSSRDPGWSPNKLPWDTLDASKFTINQRYAISHWFALLSVFDGSGPAAFSRALIHTYEKNEEDPLRKCFSSIVRDEVNHEEFCQLSIQKLTPNGPLNYHPETDLGKIAQNNIKWLYHNGVRYWNGYKKSINKYPLAILFTSFLMGELAASTLFHGMYKKSTIEVFKEGFRFIGKDEARHLAICLETLKVLLPKLNSEQKVVITRQIRAGFVFLSGVLYEPPNEFWELPEDYRASLKILEYEARSAGLGILTIEERKENWKEAILRMKGIIEPYGILFPAIPEIGIDGESVSFDAEDIIPVF